MDKPKFDPSKPFEAIENKPKFDPTRPFETEREPSLMLSPDATDEEVAAFEANRDKYLDSQPSTLSDFGSGVAQGASFGLIDELKGMGKGSLLGGVKEAGKYIGLAPDTTDADVQAYQQARDTSRQEYKDAEARSPAAYLTGMLGGGLASSLATGGAGVLAKGAQLGKLGVAGLAAGEGAALGAGTSEAETPLEFGKDVATSAALSAGGSVLLPKVASTLGTSGTLGALAGGVGTYALDEDATPAEIAAGAGAGYLAGKGLGKVGSKVSELPIVKTFLRGKAAGEEGVNLLSRETRDNILEGERTAASNQARSISDAQKAANESVEQTRANLTKKLQSDVERHNVDVDAAKKEFSALQKKTIDLTKTEQSELQGVKRQNTAKEIRREAEDLAKKVDGIRKDSGKTIESVYDNLEKTPIKIKTSEPLRELSDQIGAVAQNIPENDPSRIGLEKLVTRLQDFSGDISAKEFKELQKVIKNYAYDGTVSDPNVQRLLKGSYYKLNQQAIGDIAAQGGEEFANQLASANNTYSKIFTIEDQLGRYGAYKSDVKAVRVLEDLFKTQEGAATKQAKASLGQKYQKFFDSLKEVDPDTYKRLTTEVMDLSKQYAEAGKALDPQQIRKLAEDKLQQLVVSDPQVAKLAQVANLPKLEFSKEIVEKAIPSELLDKQKVASEMRQLVGKQLPIESTGGIQPSGDIFKMFRKDAPNELMSKQTEYKKLLPKLVGEEQSSKLFKEAEQASELSDLVSSVNQGGSYSPRLATQVISRAPAISAGLGNILGMAEKKVTGVNLASILDSATPDKLKQAGAFIIDKVSGEGTSKQFSDLLYKAAESTDPIKRRAILFTLQQNPEFRNLFNNEKN